MADKIKINGINQTPVHSLSLNGKEYSDAQHDIQARSEAIQDVLSRPPAWLVQWGITIFFGMLLMTLLLTWFLKYPDVVTGAMQINAVNLPKSVQARVEGKLISLKSHNGSSVSKGEVLGVIESTANYEEVMLLDNLVSRLVVHTQDQNFRAISNTEVPLYFQLGELQKPFQVFQENLVTSKSVLANGTYVRKKNALMRDLSTLDQLRKNIIGQLTLQEADLKLADEILVNRRNLALDGFASKDEVRQTNSQYLAKKQACEQLKMNLASNALTQNQKQQEIVELEAHISEQKNNLLQSIHTLKSEIEAWKFNFILKAPTSGKVVFFDKLQENQHVRAGQELFFVQPEGEGFYGELFLGQFNLGKVRVDQPVLIKFQAYPFQEYGILKGRVAAITDLPKDSVYRVQINFNQSQLTDIHKKIPLKNGMTAQAEIVTDDLRLIERFFYEVIKVVK